MESQMYNIHKDGYSVFNATRLPSITNAVAYEVVCTLCGSVEVDMHVQCKQTLAELKAQHAEEIARMDELSDA
jgi:hypothetical protein